MRVAVVGGGIVGVTIAYELAKRECHVTLFERGATLAPGVSRAAIGGITPISDDFLRTNFLELSAVSARIFRNWLNDVMKKSQRLVHYLDGGLLYVYFDRHSREAIDALARSAERGGIAVPHLSEAQLRIAEPGISELALGAYHIPDEGAVEPVELLKALQAALGQMPNVEIRLACDVVSCQDDAGVVELAVGEMGKEIAKLEFDFAVLAQGRFADQFVSYLKGVFRPVKGEALEFNCARGEALSRYHVYAKVPTEAEGYSSAYVVPRHDGRVAVGVTYLQGEETDHVSLGSINEITKSIQYLWPSSSNWPFIRAWAGVRPGTKDEAPVIGPLSPSRPRIVLAAGHLGVGVTLAPITAELVAEALGLASDVSLSPEIRSKLLPTRFLPPHERSQWA